MLFKNHIKPNVSHTLLDTGALRGPDILDCCLPPPHPPQKNGVIIIKRKDIIFSVFDRTYYWRFTALFSCSYTQAGSPRLSSVFLSLFIFALKILGMSSLLLLRLFANHTNVRSSVLSLRVTRRGVGVNLNSALTCVMNTMMTREENSLKFCLSADQLDRD